MMIHSSSLFSLLNPALHCFPHIRNLVLHHSDTKPAVNPGKAKPLFNTLAKSKVRLGHNRHTPLILPREIGDIPHSDRQHAPASANTKSQGRGDPEKNIAVPRDDAASHGGDKNIEGTGHDLLAAGLGWGEIGNSVCERLLEVEGAVHGIVKGVLGGDSVLVQKTTAISNLNC